MTALHTNSNVSLCAGMGKLYHPGLPPNNDGNKSWTEPDRYSQNGELPIVPTVRGSAVPNADVQAIRDANCITGIPGGSYCELPNGTRGPDDALMEAAVTSVGILANFTKATGRPFFLGVGFHKYVGLLFFLFVCVWLCAIWRCGCTCWCPRV